MAKAEIELVLRGKTPREWAKRDAVIEAAETAKVDVGLMIRLQHTLPVGTVSWHKIEALYGAVRALQEARDE